MPNITTNHAITYPNCMTSGILLTISQTLITFYKWYILYQINAMQICLPVLSALNLLINATYFTSTNKNVL